MTRLSAPVTGKLRHSTPQQRASMTKLDKTVTALKNSGFEYGHGVYRREYLYDGEPILLYTVQLKPGWVAEMQSDSPHHPDFYTSRQESAYEGAKDRAMERFAKVQEKLKALGWHEKWI